MSQSSGLSYLSLSQQVNKLVSTDKLTSAQNLLWHYTSLDAFGKIISTNSIRSTELNKMNDYMEGKWLIAQLFALYPHLAFGPVYQILSREFRLIRHAEVEASTFSYRFDPGPFQVGPVFSLSLSADGDLLSQWRAYADGGRGVAIGFDPNVMKTVCRLSVDQTDENGTILFPVEYGPAPLKGVIDLIAPELEKAERSAKYPMTGKCQKWNHGALSAAFRETTRLLRRFGPLFKNPAFREEAEWRLVYFHDLRNTLKDISFRFSQDDIRPYVCFDSIVSAIKSIRLGPLCRVDEIAARAFLTKFGADKSCSITRSKATLQ